MSIPHADLKGQSVRELLTRLVNLDTLFIGDTALDASFINALDPPDDIVPPACAWLTNLTLFMVSLPPNILVQFIRHRIRSDKDGPQPGGYLSTVRLFGCLDMADTWTENVQLLQLH
jgi:hypothetical protein